MGMGGFFDFGRSSRDELRARVRLLELKVDQLSELQGLPIAPPTAAHPDVEREAAAGNSIAAIKAYRAATGAGLREAKEAVDAMILDRSQR